MGSKPDAKGRGMPTASWGLRVGLTRQQEGTGRRETWGDSGGGGIWDGGRQVLGLAGRSCPRPTGDEVTLLESPPASNWDCSGVQNGPRP